MDHFTGTMFNFKQEIVYFRHGHSMNRAMSVNYNFGSCEKKK